MKPYEAWCHACNVTFPPEQKKCLHCGARLHPERPSRRMRESRREPELVLTPGGFEEVPPAMASVPGRTTAPTSGVPVEEEEPVRRSLIRAGMTVVWMVLLAAGYAWRACSQS